MPIVSTDVQPIRFHKGGNSALVRYTFASGKVIDPLIRGVGIDQASALARAIALIPRFEESVERKDAERAAQNDVDINDSGESTKQLKAKHFLNIVHHNADLLLALNRALKVFNFFQSQGWTAAQIKAQLDINDNIWSEIITRRDYLIANEATIRAMNTTLNNDPVGGF